VGKWSYQSEGRGKARKTKEVVGHPERQFFFKGEYWVSEHHVLGRNLGQVRKEGGGKLLGLYLTGIGGLASTERGPGGRDRGLRGRFQNNFVITRIKRDFKEKKEKCIGREKMQ